MTETHDRRTFLVRALALAGSVGAYARVSWAQDGEDDIGGRSVEGTLPDASGTYGNGACSLPAVTAAALKARYEAIDVFPINAEGAPWTVKVGTVPYLNGRDAKALVASAGWQAKDGLVAALAADPERQATLGGRGNQILVDAHSGKASPEDVAVTLQLVAYYQPPQFDDSAGVPAGLRQYFRSFLGLDCNGFAGNFALVNNLSGNPSLAPADWAAGARAGYPRKGIEDFCAGDVIVYAGASHIAVIDQRLDEKSFSVVEACYEGADRGLVASRHTFAASASGGGMFSATPERRPTPRDVWVVSI